MTFVFPTLAAVGAALALGPIIVHLLNRRRRRVVPWAAMDFLLASDRRNKTRVRLTEWLLLASRVLAVAAAGLLAAGPRTTGLLDGWFGAAPATHYVLLDDTASMRSQGAEADAWRRATQAIQRLAESAERHGDRVEVVRYTDLLTQRRPDVLAATEPATGGAAPPAPSTWRPSYASGGPADALDLIAQRLADRAEGGPGYAYLFSDFAGPDHDAATGWSSSVERLSNLVSGVVLATVGGAGATNLAIESLELEPGPRAAGVEQRLRIELVNDSDSAVGPTPVTIERNGAPLATIEAGPLDPRGRRAIEAPVRLPGEGVHAVAASIGADALQADNRRWLAIETAAARPVLLLADDGADAEARVFSAALSPTGSSRSGWAPHVRSRLTDEDLTDAAAVLVLDKQRLSAQEIRRLERYVATGGGALVVAGPQTDAEWFDLFWRSVGGRAKLGPPTSPPPVDPGQAVLTANDHPAVRVLRGERNSFLPLVHVLAFRKLESDGAAQPLRQVSERSSATSESIVEMVDGSPLMVESQHARGRVITLLTTAAASEPDGPPWTNLAALPVFPVLANDLVAWLSQQRLRPPAETIGAGAVGADSPRDTLLRLNDSGDPTPAAGLGPGAPLSPAEPGVYRRVVGGVEEAPFSADVDPRESDLRAPPLEELRRRFADVARVAVADELFREEDAPQSRVFEYALAAALLLLLAAERVLAYRSSHVATDAVPAPRRGR
ncbi:BatA domain-containing protein [Botrimarina sp.]|uniref:BatA domain-containing protein n=1 Tax=Botrimarina sp. TaxID=2795802 RepID=UPI0032ED1431